ncbi:alpha/beta hydrolase [Parasediminibacterium paludis]|uniref:Alpha/beta hydrolase n=1 Tax=Parasediminibacterium paludis TaxID=908966 RepID=A0ABV8PUL8_9BACT
MKLAQSIAINYYKTKITTLALISPRKAAEYAFKIFCTPYSGKPVRPEPTSFLEAEKISFQFEGLTLRGWHWQPKEPNGKKILINHGFDSFSYRFEKYIHPMLKAGFEVFAYDAPGHGISDGKTINALFYSQSMLEFNKIFGPLYGIMAHSIGGLAASLAAEHLPSLEKLVLIAPAVETTTAIKGFIKFLGLGNDMKQALTDYIVDFSKQPISYFATSTAVQKFHIPTLWLHDTEDAICTFEDVKPVQALNLPHIEFYITTGLGHSKIYREGKTVKTIINFLKK